MNTISQTHDSENYNLLLNTLKGMFTGLGFGIVLSIGYFAIVTLVIFFTSAGPDLEMTAKYGPIIGYFLGFTALFLLGLVTMGLVTIPPYILVGLITGLFIGLTFALTKPTSSRMAILLGIVDSIVLSIGIHEVACTYLELCINSYGYYIFIGYPALLHILSGGCMGWLLFRLQK